MSDEEKDIIHQDTRIVQQFIKQFTGNKDRIQFNNITIGQIRIAQAETKDVHEMLLFVLERLPKPRMDSLKKLAYEVADNKFREGSSAATWLGRTYRSLTNSRKKLVKLPVLEEEDAV